MIGGNRVVALPRRNTLAGRPRPRMTSPVSIITPVLVERASG